MRQTTAVWVVAFLTSCATPGGEGSAPTPQDRFTTGSDEELALADQLAHAWLDAHPKLTDRWTTRRVVIDRLATAHVRVTQQHDGVDVFGGELVVHLGTDGSITSVTDGAVHGITVDTVPLYTSDEAKDFGVEAAGGWARVTSEPTTRLVILRHDDVDSLCWQIDVPMLDGTADSAIPRVFVDAHDAAIVWQYDNLQSAEPGSATTAYNGPIAFGVTYDAGEGAYVLLDDHHGTYDFENRSYELDVDPVIPQSALVHVESPTTAFPGTGSAAAGPDAHFAVGRTLAYFDEVHGRQGPDDAWGPSFRDGVITSGVHYGNGVANAYWNPVNDLMIFGDGDGVFTGPVTSLDVGAHELTHAMTQYLADLIYAGEPGALNESMSDVFGAIVEHRERGPSDDVWLIGEQLFSPSVEGDALRYMHDPTLDGSSRDHYVTRYVGTDDNGGVHWNSGIGNLAFHLVVEGGSHPIPAKSVGVVPALGIDAAGDIWYRALDLYLTPGSSFLRAFHATHGAAQDLDPDGTDAAAVLAAWEEVGVVDPDILQLDTSQPTGAWVRVSVEVPSSTARLRVHTWGGTGDADLYIVSGASVECVSGTPTNREYCAILDPTAGTWDVWVYAYQTYTHLNLMVEVDAACSPGATEIEGNGFDEDCDGWDAVCNLTPGGGCDPQVAITEIMVNPRQYPFGLGWPGEWVELTNRSTHAVDLKGGRLWRLGTPPRVKDFESSLVLQPGESTVIAGYPSAAVNGGVKRVLETLDDITLPNGGGRLQLRDGPTGGARVLDDVTYTATHSSGGQIPRGASLSVDRDHATPTGNDSATHWCDARTPFGDGSFGTPGAANDDCDWELDVHYQYDVDGDTIQGEANEPHGDTTVFFEFDATARWFTTGNQGTGGGALNPGNLIRRTTSAGQRLTFTYDDTFVTYTTLRPFGDTCWPGGVISNIPPEDAVSGSFQQTGCTEP